MEIRFWRYLATDDAVEALPLRQRIPEVALFNGDKLEACYYSNNRGLLQRRPPEESTHEALLNRLLSLAVTTRQLTQETEIDPNTPAAILRRPGPSQDHGASDAPPSVTVLSAAQVAMLLDRVPEQQSGGDTSGDWSLQSIVPPAEDLRIVAVYSGDKDGAEELSLVGRKYQAFYDSSASSAPDHPVPVPEDGRAAVEAKVLSLVRYVQRYYGYHIESLLAEFLLDTSNRVVLHAFWKVAFFDQVAEPQEQGRAVAESADTCATPSIEGAVLAHAEAEPLGSVNSSVMMPPPGCAAEEACGASVWASAASLSTVDCSSAGNSRPTSAVTLSSSIGQVSRPVSAAHSSILDMQSQGAAGGSSSSSRGPALSATPLGSRPQSPPSQMTSINQDGDLGIPIMEDDGEGDDAIDEAIERLRGEAASVSSSAQRRNRPNAARQQKAEARPASARASRRGLEPVPEPKTWRPQSAGAGLEVDGRSVRPRGARPQPSPPDGRPNRPSSARPSSARRNAPASGSQPAASGGCPPAAATATVPAPSAPTTAPAREASSLGPTQVQFAWPSTAPMPSAPSPTPSAPSAPAPAPKQVERRRPSSASAAERKRPASASTAACNAKGAGCRGAGSQWTGRWSTPRAGSARPSSARRRQRSSRPASATSRPSAPAAAPSAPPKKLVYSQQLLSRHTLERDARSRLLSTLARQMERYRDLVPAWLEQRRVVELLELRSERDRQSHAGELGRVLAEREVIVKEYERKAEVLAKGLTVEKEAATISADSVKRELNKSIDLERETTEVLKEEEAKNKALRSSLDRTVEQLNILRTEILQYQSEAEEVKHGRTAQSAEEAPEMQQALRRLDGINAERQQVNSDIATARAELLRVQDELNQQRAYSKRLEDFVRRISAGGRYVLDPMRKREAASLLHAAEKLRAKACGASADWTTAAAHVSSQESRSADVRLPSDEEVKAIAAQIMDAADGIGRNGYLSISELQAFLAEGTAGGHRFGKFMSWLLSARERHFKRWDSDRDGGISLPELENAVQAFLTETAVAASWTAAGRGHTCSTSFVGQEPAQERQRAVGFEPVSMGSVGGRPFE